MDANNDADNNGGFMSTQPFDGFAATQQQAFDSQPPVATQQTFSAGNGDAGMDFGQTQPFDDFGATQQQQAAAMPPPAPAAAPMALLSEADQIIDNQLRSFETTDTEFNATQPFDSTQCSFVTANETLPALSTQSFDESLTTTSGAAVDQSSTQPQDQTSFFNSTQAFDATQEMNSTGIDEPSATQPFSATDDQLQQDNGPESPIPMANPESPTPNPESPNENPQSPASNPESPAMANQDEEGPESPPPSPQADDNAPESPDAADEIDDFGLDLQMEAQGDDESQPEPQPAAVADREDLAESASAAAPVDGPSSPAGDDDDENLITGNRDGANENEPTNQDGENEDEPTNQDRENEDERTNQEETEEGGAAEATAKRKKAVISDDEDDEPGPSSSAVDGQPPAELDDDDEDNQESGRDADQAAVGELIADIFGDDSEGEGDGDGDADAQQQQQLTTTEAGELDDEGNDEDQPGSSGKRPHDFEWDFDVIMRQKKDERKAARRRGRRGITDLMSDADDLIKEFIANMKHAAAQDRTCIQEGRPAVNKRKLLPMVLVTLRKADIQEALMDLGIMDAVSEWLAVLPDKSLPALEIRTELLKLLQSFAVETPIIRQSGIGKATMMLYKHPRETGPNKRIAGKLISEWARKVFALDNSLSKEEREERDYEHMSSAKRKRMSEDSGRTRSTDDDAVLRPGDKGWVGRARVPKPSSKDYIVRPTTAVDIQAQFKNESKGKGADRFNRAFREFKDRTRNTKQQHAIGLSLEGRKIQ